ncbi:MAG: (2Fe-2S)-binding protein, partial [Bacteroidota bacterium]
MSVGYKPVVWTIHKKKYDRWLGLAILTYLALFIGITFGLHPKVLPITVLIRATGSLALLMLHVILLIGPLARLDSRFLPV